MMNTNVPLVELCHISKRYLLTWALQDVTLTIEPGVITGLLGPNGSGKSTLLKSIFGFVLPTSGQVKVAGRKPDRAVKAQVAYLPEVDHLYPWMSVGRIIEFVSSFYDDWDWEKTEELMKVSSLPTGRTVGALSKGQRARLKLVLTLSRNAPLLLLDEPLSGIDPPSRSRILEAIAMLFQADRQSIVLSTHEVSEAEVIFDSVILLEQGRVKLTGSADEIRQKTNKSLQAVMEEAYL
ncbi:MAG: ABC transporter ATP-binding protein [Limnochordia bacterium]|nr:ABC transporter ATP-binding protein [Limnochordia bacterium]MDD4518797.1 ABC transporter ATP-binding protein [Limnochordia bacterium]